MWVEPLHAANTNSAAPRLSEHKVAVLLNAHARKVTPRVVRALTHVVPQGDLFLSKSELDARRIAQQVVDRGYHTVFLGGGDGTLMCFINEIANQVALRRQHFHTPMPKFGVLKLGTGNSVASLVNASPLSGDGIVDDVLRARAGEVAGYRTVDMLLVDGKRAPFAGLGVDGKLLNDYISVKETFKDTVVEQAMSRVMSGPTGYLASVALKTVPWYLVNSSSVECEAVNTSSTPAYRVGPDGKPVGDAIAPGATIFKGTLMMASAGTVPFYGFELKMFPFAGIRRGMMNLRLGTVNPGKIIGNLPGLWRGTWFPQGLQDFLARDVTIRFDRAMPFQMGGDAQGYREEVRFQIASEPIDLVDFSELRQ